MVDRIVARLRECQHNAALVIGYQQQTSTGEKRVWGSRRATAMSRQSSDDGGREQRLLSERKGGFALKATGSIDAFHLAEKGACLR